YHYAEPVRNSSSPDVPCSQNNQETFSAVHLLHIFSMFYPPTITVYPCTLGKGCRMKTHLLTHHCHSAPAVAKSVAHRPDGRKPLLFDTSGPLSDRAYQPSARPFFLSKSFFPAKIPSPAMAIK